MANCKEDKLAELVKLRRSEVPPGYSCVSRFHDKKYDCNYVSPWSKSAHNLDAEVMIIAQDWASDEYLKKPFDPVLQELGHDPSFPTNKCLFRLLEEHIGLKFSDTYATNATPFIKPGNVTAPISLSDLRFAAQKFALPQIQIVQPLMVICLGIRTFGAIRSALFPHEKPSRVFSWKTYENSSVETKCGISEIHAVTHLGNMGQIGRKHKIAPEWNRVGARLRELRVVTPGRTQRV